MPLAQLPSCRMEQSPHAIQRDCLIAVSLCRTLKLESHKIADGGLHRQWRLGSNVSVRSVDAGKMIALDVFADPWLRLVGGSVPSKGRYTVRASSELPRKRHIMGDFCSIFCAHQEDDLSRGVSMGKTGVSFCWSRPLSRYWQLQRFDQKLLLFDLF